MGIDQQNQIISSIQDNLNIINQERQQFISEWLYADYCNIKQHTSDIHSIITDFINIAQYTLEQAGLSLELETGVDIEQIAT